MARGVYWFFFLHQKGVIIRGKEIVSKTMASRILNHSNSTKLVPFFPFFKQMLTEYDVLVKDHQEAQVRSRVF